MKRKLIAVLTLISGGLFSDNLSLDSKVKSWNRDHHLYIDFGSSDMIPAVGFGWRSKYYFLGADLSCKIPFTFHSPVFYKNSASLLFYPEKEGFFYLGVGISTMSTIVKFFDRDYHLFGNSFTIGGYNKKEKPTFWQLSVEFFPRVHLRWEGEEIIKPFISYSYGICF